MAAYDLRLISRGGYPLQGPRELKPEEDPDLLERGMTKLPRYTRKPSRELDTLTPS